MSLPGPSRKWQRKPTIGRLASARSWASRQRAHSAIKFWGTLAGAISGSLTAGAFAVSTLASGDGGPSLPAGWTEYSGSGFTAARSLEWTLDSMRLTDPEIAPVLELTLEDLFGPDEPVSRHYAGDARYDRLFLGSLEDGVIEVPPCDSSQAWSAEEWITLRSTILARELGATIEPTRAEIDGRHVSILSYALGEAEFMSTFAVGPSGCGYEFHLIGKAPMRASSLQDFSRFLGFLDLER